MRFLVLALILVASSALAQPGTLDATFGGDGRVMLDVGAGTGDGSGADRAIPLSDGDILVIGGVGEDAFAARLNQDGSLDPGFGSGGIARVDAGGFEERFTDAVVLESGAIVLSGARQSKDDDEGFVARLTATGQLDPTFGSNGLFVLAPPVSFSRLFGVAVRSDGRIVAGGEGLRDGEFEVDALLVQLTPLGELDPAFGEDGIARFRVTDRNLFTNALALDADGSTLLVGFSSGAFDAVPFIVRFDADGQPVDAFGNNGIAEPDFGGLLASILGVAIDGEGRIVIVGNGGEKESVVVVARLDAAGQPDTGFGTEGFVAESFMNRSPVGLDVTLQDDGKILVGGGVGAQGASNFFAARYIDKGQRDAGFGQDGLVTVDFGGGDEVAFSISLQPDGRIVLAGVLFDDDPFEPLALQALLARLENDALSPTASEPIADADELRLSVYPNPFLQTATLTVTLDAPGPVDAVLFDVLGRRVATIYEGSLGTGAHSIALAGAGLPPAIYVVRVRVGNQVYTHRITRTG